MGYRYKVNPRRGLFSFSVVPLGYPTVRRSRESEQVPLQSWARAYIAVPVRSYLSNGRPRYGHASPLLRTGGRPRIDFFRFRTPPHSFYAAYSTGRPFPVHFRVSFREIITKLHLRLFIAMWILNFLLMRFKNNLTIVSFFFRISRGKIYNWWS